MFRRIISVPDVGRRSPGKGDVPGDRREERAEQHVFADREREREDRRGRQLRLSKKVDARRLSSVEWHELH